MEQQAHTRKIDLDCLRILACIGVIYNHVMGHAVTESSTLVSYWTLFDYFLCKMAVPVFFMISGTLLLSRTEDYKKTLWRVVRIGLALTLAMTVNYVSYCMETGEKFHIGMLILSVYRDRLGVTYSYWYLYRYMSLLVMMPLLQRMMTQMRARDMRYFLLFAVGVCGASYAVALLWPDLRPNQWLTLPLFSCYIGMLIQGYYLDRCVEKRKGDWIVAAAGLVLFNALAAYLFYRYQMIDAERAWYLDRCDRTSVMLAAGCLFYLVKRLFGRLTLSLRLQRAVSYVGKMTFCIYLVSELLIDRMSGIRGWLDGVMAAGVADRLYVLIVFAAGLLLASVLTRVPLLKKIL